jgi:hypothetical protein
MTCPEPDCTHPAGTRCTYHGCPGRSFKNPRAPFSPLSRGHTGEVALNRTASPISQINLLSHEKGITA